MQDKDLLVKRLQEINTKKELDRLLKLPMKKFIEELVETRGFFQSEIDLKLFILEYMEITFKDDLSEWPIRYYSENEDLEPVEEESLTDKYIQEQMYKIPSPNLEKR